MKKNYNQKSDPLKRRHLRSKKQRAFSLICGAVLGLSVGANVASAAEVARPLDFVLGVPGRTGCLVCHGDPKIKNVKDKRSLYISQEVMGGSSHKDVACVACHTDFSIVSSIQAHKNKDDSFRIVAGLSCKNCHQHVEQLKEYSRSVHGRLALGGDKKRGATCADCHGSHDIRSFKKDEAYKLKYQMSGMQTCGKCHKEYAESYNDYYHGHAYQMQATDAPACWDCHGAHQIASKNDPNSLISKRHLAKTCGKCHEDSRDELTQYAVLIHGSEKVKNSNLVHKYKNMVITWLDSNVIKNVGHYYKSITMSLFSRPWGMDK